MCSLPGRCRRILHLIGYIEKGARVCAMQLYQMGSPRTSTLMIITPPCQAGSRGWRLLSESMVYGQKKDFWHSVKTSGARTALPTVAASAYFFVNRISGLKSLALRSSSHSTGTFVTSIWSTIVSLTLLNSIGALQNFIITTPCGPLTLLRWRKIWLPALTMSHCFRLYGMLTVWYLIWIFTQTDSHLNLDMQTGLQDSFWHMTLGYWVQRPLGPIKNTMDITHYLQSCLQRFGEPKLTCLHLCSNILSVFSQLTLLYLFFFFEVSIWPLLAPSQWLHKNAGIKCCLSYPLKCVKKTDPQFFKNLPDVLEWEDHFSKIWKGLGPPPPKKKITI